MKKLLSILALALILAGCSDIFNKPASPTDGLGMVNINIGGTNARTLLPEEVYGTFYYVLSFTRDGDGKVVVESLTGVTNKNVELLSGNWTVDVKGFLSAADTGDASKALVTGSATFPVNAGQGTTVTVDVTPNADRLTQKANGKLAYSVTLPAGANGTLQVLKLLDGSAAATPIELTAGIKNGEITLPSAFYYVTVNANFDGKEKVWRELAQIYDNAVTKAACTLQADDFNAANAAITGFDTGVPNVYTDIDENTRKIIVIVPPGTPITSFTPVITFEGAMIKPTPGELQDFTNPVTYTVYAEGGEEKSYTVTVSDKIESVGLLAEYLADMDLPTVPVKLKLDLDTEWQNVLTALSSAGKSVNLDLSDSWGMETFDPGTANTGESKIVSLTLPNSTTATKDASYSSYSSYPLFRYFTSLAEIKGAGIKTLGSGAFKGYDSSTPNTTLTSYDFPALEFIGAGAFYNCDGLSGDLIIPDSVTTIGAYAFLGCGELSGALTIPDSVKTIGEYAFSNCGGFTGDLIIPDNVTTLGRYAFYNCSGFTGDLIISNSIATISDYAFYGCEGLSGALIIPDGVKTIGGGAFRDCGNLTGPLNIPDSVTTIREYAFYDCGSLTGSLTIPKGTNAIASSIFYGCRSLTGNLNIPNTVKTIGWGAFGGCSGLTGQLNIPAGVTTIGGSAFYNCSGLTGTLTIPAGVTTIEERVFSGCSGLTEPLTIPANVTIIYQGAFENCSGFSGSLTIPDKVTVIWPYAFYNCTGLTDVTIGIGTYSIKSKAFEGYQGPNVTIKYKFATTSNVDYEYDCFPGDLAYKYENMTTGGPGTYTRNNANPPVWTRTKQL